MEQQLHDEIENALRFAERKPELIKALLVEMESVRSKLVALGYQPPKRTRKPRAPAAEGSAAQEPKRRRTKSA